MIELTSVALSTHKTLYRTRKNEPSRVDAMYSLIAQLNMVQIGCMMRTPENQQSHPFTDTELLHLIKLIADKRLEQSGCVGLWALGICGLTYGNRSCRDYHKLLLHVSISLDM